MEIEVRVELEAVKSFREKYMLDFKLYETMRIERRK